MFYLIQYGSDAGTIHKKNNICNQDALYCTENDKYFSAVLSDGAGSHKFAEIGAETTVKTVGNYLKENFDLIINGEYETVQHEIMSVIRAELKKTAEINNHGIMQGFGSTLIFAASDGKRFVLGHLGDGAIIGLYNNNLSVISFPENGPDGISTYLTTMFNAEHYLRIMRGNLDYYDEFILITDGLIPVVFKSGYIPIEYGDYSIILDSAVNTKKHEDDASYIKIKWR